MCVWSKNNRACTTTWTTLRVLDQLVAPFNEAGDIRMDQLGYWAKAASEDMRHIQASALGVQIDNMFRLIRKAQFEEGVDAEKALADTLDILTTGDKTVCELAEVVDANYQFWGEDV